MKIFILALFMAPLLAVAQSGTGRIYTVQETGITGILKLPDLSEVPIIKYSDNSYTECNTAHPRLKVPAGSKFKAQKCSVIPGSSTTIKVASTKLTYRDMETIIRSTAPEDIIQLPDSIIIKSNYGTLKLPVSDAGPMIAYVDNYKKSSYSILHPENQQLVGATAAAYSNVQFEFDESLLRTSTYPNLDAIAGDLRSNPAKTVGINGYASSEGTAAHNMRLSKDRANAVKSYLVNSGIEASRLKIKAYGESNPIADNSTEEGRIINRRVEFNSN